MNIYFDQLSTTTQIKKVVVQIGNQTLKRKTTITRVVTQREVQIAAPKVSTNTKVESTPVQKKAVVRYSKNTNAY